MNFIYLVIGYNQQRRSDSIFYARPATWVEELSM